MPMRSMFCERIFARSQTGSLHTSTPCPPMRKPLCVDFPPGAAHKSSTCSPGCAFSTAAGSIALGSCKYHAPASCSTSAPAVEVSAR